ncbi:hypothetical protein [uncultured Cohaesibacter sp.]|uniref:hypothetical protein n=1 Tax=uncultured Cohaesibacter sp. TaxID=1002546 RepID=UPI0029C6D290|nr:hypothetical protein [uncultured Cohaesibacter sp.]
MTTRKSNNRTEAKGKPVKTIDLTAEDVTASKRSAADAGEDISKPEESEIAAADVSARASEEKIAEAVASDGAEETKADVGSEDQEFKSDLAESTVSQDEADGKAADDSKKDDSSLTEEETSSEAFSATEADSGGDSGAPPASSVPAATSSAPSKSGGFAGGFIGGLLGGVAIIALGYVGLQQGWVSLPADNVKIDALEADLASLQTKLSQIPVVDSDGINGQLAALAGRLDALETSAPATMADEAADTQDTPTQEVEAEPVDSNSPVGLQLEALAGRIEELKQGVAGFDALQNELLDLKAQLANLQAEAARQAALIESKASEQAAKLQQDLQSAKDDILSSADRRINDVVVELSNFSDKISTEAASLRERVTGLEENNLSAEMQSSARTIALAGLENAVASGGSYRLALKTFANVVGDHEAVTILDAHADAGAPTAAALAADFRVRYDAILREAEGAGATTLLDKFLISAQSMVKVRSLNGEQKGNSLTSMLGVIEYHVKQGDLVKAAEEWDALPEAARNSKAGSDWIEGLKARIAVDAAMDTIRAEFGTGASNKAG